jgi:hypothetical protein
MAPEETLEKALKNNKAKTNQKQLVNVTSN